MLPWLAAALVMVLLRAEREPLAGAVRHPRPLVLCGLALLLWVAALAVPAPLEPRADPADLEYTPRPEWYFLWPFQIRRRTDARPWVRSALVPGLALVALAAPPLLPPLPRARRLGAAAALALGRGALTGLVLWQDRDLKARPGYEDALDARAAEVYADDCRGCHGEAGRRDGERSRAFGLEARDFTSPAFWARTVASVWLPRSATGWERTCPTSGAS